MVLVMVPILKVALVVLEIIVVNSRNSGCR